MTEMQDAIAGNDFHATGRVVTPLGAELIKHKMFPDNTIWRWIVPAHWKRCRPVMWSPTLTS